MSTFIYPTVHRVTSDFRPSHRKNHNGTDFANSGYHEIKASAAGRVNRSYLSTSYGECVMIVHTINGVTWETVYAHMRSGSRKVNVGQSVKQGQVIGVMGNTGHSTGQHLHFELHKGLWNAKKSNAVDPLKYLGASASPSKDNVIANIQKWIGTIADGIDGPNTQKALIKKLQKELNIQNKAGLVIDGVWGAKTRNAVITIRNGAKGNLTKVLQSALYLAGYTEVGTPDGDYGKNTKKALGNFQRKNNLAVDHAAGKVTFTKLFG